MKIMIAIGCLLGLLAPWQAEAKDWEFKICVGTLKHTSGTDNSKTLEYILGKTFAGTLYGASCDPTAPFEVDISFSEGEKGRVNVVTHWTKVAACNGGKPGTIEKKNRLVGENLVYLVTSWFAILQDDGSIVMTEFDDYQNKAGTIPDSKLHATTLDGCISGLLKPQ